MKYTPEQKARRNENARRRYAANPEAAAARQRRYMSGNRHKARAYAMKANYGISTEQWDSMYARQGGACAICREPSNSGRRLHTDHHHATGTVRGLLCSECNQGLGKFRDSTSRLAAAVRYLDRE